MALFPVTDHDRQIYETELKDFLPDKIIDVHTHVYLKSLQILPPNAPKRPRSWPSFVAEDNSIEDLEETYRLLFPGKQVTPLMFGNKGGSKAGWVQQNAYLSDVSRRTGYPALYYSMPDQSGEEIEREIRAGGFLGVKSYYTFAPAYIPRKEARIFDFFPKNQLETLDRMGAIVMCHIPRDGRLRDPVNLEQILELRSQFPHVRLIVAHIGRAYTRQDVGRAFPDYLDREPETMYDFSANCCDYAIRELLTHAGTAHAMFGTDLPVLRMRTRRIEENGTYINLVPPGLYGEPGQDPHLREVSAEEARNLTFFAYEELLAFKRVCTELGLGRQAVVDMMFNNADRLIRGARASIYGCAEEP